MLFDLPCAIAIQPEDVFQTHDLWKSGQENITHNPPDSTTASATPPVTLSSQHEMERMSQ